MDDATKAALDALNDRLAAAERATADAVNRLDAMAGDVRHALQNAADISGFSRALVQLHDTVKKYHENTFGPGTFVLNDAENAAE